MMTDVDCRDYRIAFKWVEKILTRQHPGLNSRLSQPSILAHDWAINI